MPYFLEVITARLMMISLSTLVLIHYLGDRTTDASEGFDQPAEYYWFLDPRRVVSDEWRIEREAPTLV